MPLSSSASSFFGKLGPQEAGPLTNQGNPAQGIASASQFKTPNLFDTIQAVRQNELDRQAKQAQIATVLQELAMAPQKQAYQQAQMKKLLYDMDPNSVENQIRAATLSNQQDQQKLAREKLPLEEMTAMSRSGYKPMQSRESLLNETPQERRSILGNRAKGPVTEKYFSPKNSNIVDPSKDPSMILAGITSEGKPRYISKNYMQAQRDMITENPSIDLDTQKAIAAVKFAEPRLQKIESLIDSGSLGNDETFKKFVKEIQVQGKGPTLRYTVKDGSPLEELMSEINSLRIGGFGIAGTAYTDTEREIVEFGLDPRGKSLSQIKQDIRIVQDFMTEKARSGTMGLKEARNVVKQFKSLRESKSSSEIAPGYSSDEWEVVSG